MVTDIAIWNAPLPPVQYGGSGAAATYVPVKAYLKTIRAVVQAHPVPVEIVATVHDGSGIDVGRARAAIQLYSSIFNYRDPPAGRLCVRV